MGKQINDEYSGLRCGPFHWVNRLYHNRHFWIFSGLSVVCLWMLLLAASPYQTVPPVAGVTLTPTADETPAPTLTATTTIREVFEESSPSAKFWLRLIDEWGLIALLLLIPLVMLLIAYSFFAGVREGVKTPAVGLPSGLDR